MKKRLGFFLVLISLGILIVPISSNAADPIDLKFAYWPPPMAVPVAKGIHPWGEKIEAATKGRVKVTFFGGEAMAKAPDHYDLVLKGTADIVWIDPNHVPGAFPLSESIALPFLWSDAEECSAVMWKAFDKYLKDTEYGKVKLLFTFSIGMNDFHGRKPVKSLADLKGLKLASMAPVHSKTIKALGASGVFMIEPEVYTAMERGMLDGRFFNWEGCFVFKNFEVTKYRIQGINIFTMPNIIMMNKDKWNSLPDDIKKIIDAESGLNYSRFMGKLMQDANDQFMQMILDHDKKVGNPPTMKISDAELAKWVKATEPVIEDWVAKHEKKGRPAQAMLDDIRKMIKEYK
jgi:TRAP-type C4-dicarboxylate transport system substrate-binding protein